MSGSISEAMRDGAEHTADSLAERLPSFPPEAIRDALEALAAQGVLARTTGDDGLVRYRYAAPELYGQINQDVIRDPGTGIRRRPR